MTTDSRVDAAETTPEVAPEMRDCRRCSQPMAMTKNKAYQGRRHRARGLCVACCTSVARAGELDQYPRLQRRREDVVAAYEAYMQEHPRAKMRDAADALEIPRTSLSMTLARHREALAATEAPQIVAPRQAS